MRDARDNAMFGAPARRPALLVGLLLVAVFQSGCYRRVIRAEGWGYESTVVEEPYAHEGPVDDMLFGKRETERKDPEPTKPRRAPTPD